MLADCLKLGNLMVDRNTRRRKLFSAIVSPYVGEIEGMFSVYNPFKIQRVSIRELSVRFWARSKCKLHMTTRKKNENDERINE